MRTLPLCLSGLLVSLVSTLAAAQTVRRIPASLASPAPVEDAVEPPTYVEPAKEKRGFVLDLASSLVVPTGAWVRGVSASDFGPGSGAALLLGVYVSSHVGLIVGAEGSFGHAGGSGCSSGKSSSDAACGGITYGFPALLELSLTDRKRGLYFQLGAKIMSTYLAYGDGGTITAMSPADGRFGLGYRWAQESFRSVSVAPSWGSLDLYGAVEAGEFMRVGTSSANVDVPASAREFHRTYELGVKIHFTP